MATLLRANPRIILSADKSRVAVDASQVDPRVGSLPGAQTIVSGDKRLYIIPYTVDNFIRAHRLGVPLDAPIRHRYPWAGRFTPMAHQHTTSAFCTLFNKAFVLNGLGLGKTLSVLWAADFLAREGLLRKTLILSTLSTLTPVWGVEIFQHFPHRRYHILHGAGKKLVTEPVDFLVMNHDGLRDTDLVSKLMNDETLDLVIVDECALLRNARTRRYKMLVKLIERTPRVWMLTATPTPNGPTDAWAQARLVNPLAVPRYFKDFQTLVMRKEGMYRWSPKPEAPAIVHRALQPAIRFTPEDCLDLPPITYMERPAPMSEPQIAAYESLRKTLVTEIDGNLITAANEAVKANKLLQVACGVLYDGDASYTIQANGKVAVLLELVEESDGPVIVFAPFKLVVDQLLASLRKHKFAAEKIDGATPRGARDRIFRQFQAGELDVIVAHPQTVSHGLTLTRSATMIWFAPVWSNDIYEQAVGRIYRKGQQKHVNIFHLHSCPVELEMYQRLRGKQALQGLLLKMFSSDLDKIAALRIITNVH